MKENNEVQVELKKSLVVKLSGEITDKNVQLIRQQIDAELVDTRYLQSVDFDLSGITSVNDITIGLLIGRYKKAHKLGIETSIVNPSKNADKVLHLAGIYQLMPKKSVTKKSAKSGTKDDSEELARV